MAEEGGESLDCDYSELKDLRISLDSRVLGGWGDGTGSGFGLCFWLYLKCPINSSTVILRQMQSENNRKIPFLSMNDTGLTLFPLLVLHQEDPDGFSALDARIPNVSAHIECLKDKWVHIGCEVSTKYLRLYIDGAAKGEKSLSSFSENPGQGVLEGICLAGNDGSDIKIEGFIHDVQMFPLSSSISVPDLSKKNLPIWLSLDYSCLPDGVEEGTGGVWNIVGGKASCRRKFSLDVVLLDAFGNVVQKELEVVASLVYSDDGVAVKKSYDSAESPLIVNCEGFEFPSTERTLKLVGGRASFKLKISQLSSKCDNRLFRIVFRPLNSQIFPFLDAYSPPIHCISRSRSIRSNTQGKRHSHSPRANERSCEVQDNCSGMQMSNESDSKCTSPSPKRLRYGYDDSAIGVGANGNSPRGNGQCISQDLLINQGATENVLSDSESTDARNSVSAGLNNAKKQISDTTVFKYCLEGMDERSLLLKEVVAFTTDEDITEFAEQVSLYTGCVHHRYQILNSNQLIKEGTDSWKFISHNEDHVLWLDVIPEIDRKFRKISRSSNRGLSVQDTEVLRKIAGCGDVLGREQFDKMWRWLFPVAVTLSKDHMHALWESMSPKWIEGIITKEEAEDALKGPTGSLEPGTFILRFPTSRSWPHPDAGSLVVTYIGADYSLHTRLLCTNNREINSGPLEELLFQEPELSQLGSVRRRGIHCWGEA